MYIDCEYVGQVPFIKSVLQLRHQFLFISALFLFGTPFLGFGLGFLPVLLDCEIVESIRLFLLCLPQSNVLGARLVHALLS